MVRFDLAFRLVPLPISVEHGRGGGLAGRAGDLLGAWEIEFFWWCDRGLAADGARIKRG
jgi:hypothetical protein